MQTTTVQLSATPEVSATSYPPLELITRPTVTTEAAAYYLNRQPQTLRSWASTEPKGAIRPLRIMGRLAWPVAAIRALLEVEQ